MLTTEQKQEIIKLDAMGLKQADIAGMVGVGVKSVNRTVNDNRRVLVISDLHCGHVSGLTPPQSQTNDRQAEVWDWYSRRVKQLNPDVVFVLGDAMDGKGKRSGGSELIEASWRGQVNMAYRCISEIGCDNIHVVYGTPYHVGDDEDYEMLLADRLGANIGSHLFPVVNGIQFDLKHKIGSSGIPHGRSTALKRAKLWNVLWNDRDCEQPDADIILRGHVHYFDYTGSDRYLAMTCPALQDWGSKYGERQCEGIVNLGLVWFDVRPGDSVQTLKWCVDIPDLQQRKVLAYTA